MRDDQDGDCYIFSYEKFQNGAQPRPESKEDVKKLTQVFDKLSFNVYNHNDLTKQLTLDTLKEAAKKDHKQSKYFICCFLTHGKEGSLLMHDGQFLDINEILACFSRSACESLARKPKIFIFQACRGKNFEEGVKAVQTNSDSTDSPDSFTNNPDYLDFLLAYSTSEDTVAFKDTYNGSFFIDELCRTLKQFSNDSDLLQILTIVNYRVSRLFESSCVEPIKNKKKQMPGFTSRLTSKVQFRRQTQELEEPEATFLSPFDKRRMKSSLGQKSTLVPLEDKKIYKIETPKRVKVLFLLNMKDTFENLLLCASVLTSSVTKRGYQSEVLSNWSQEDLQEFLKEVQNFSNIDCLICFFACQSKGDFLFDVNGEELEKKEIIEQFNGKKCKNLKGKPKILIFLTSPTNDTCESSMPPVGTDSDENTIPVHSDLLEVAITIQEIKQLEGVTKKFCSIFGEENYEDFLSQFYRMFYELVKDYGFYASASQELSSFYLNSTLTETLLLNKYP